MYLRGYVDESGTHKSAKFLLIAGHVSSDLRWKRFRSEWRTVLESVGISTIISKDYASASGMFYQWPTNKLKKLGDGLLKATERLGGFGLTVRLDYKDYQDLYACEPRPKKYQLDTAYGLCFRYWTKAAADAAAFAYRNHTVPPKGLSIVLEQGAKDFGDAKRVFREMKSEPRQRCPLRYFSVGDKSVPGIQLAGIEAHRNWQSEHDDVEFIKVKTKATLPEIHTASSQQVAVFRHQLDREFIASWKAEILEIQGSKEKK